MKLLFFLSLISIVNCNKKNLFDTLFNDYNSTIRPVKNNDDNIKLKYGLEIYGLNYFNQKAERIEFNLLITETWIDEYLTWNLSEYNTKFIEVNSKQIWKPDLELYNSGKKPFLFSGDNSKVKINNNGRVLWTKFTTYSFSCMLDLHMFPFDTQKCTLLFGSWKHSNSTLDLKPFNSKSNFRNISVYEGFSHNEWNIIGTNIKHVDVEYLCCPGEFYPNTEFIIELERKSMKYNIVMIFTVFITSAGIGISFININNYKRAFVLVFIPLSIIWLQIYIADKIPVIEYSTLMEKFFMVCFTITMCLALESVSLYCLFTENFIPKRFNVIKIENFYNNNKIDVIIKNNKTIKYESLLNRFDFMFRFLILLTTIITLISILTLS